MKRTTRASSAAKGGSEAPVAGAGDPSSSSDGKAVDPFPGVPDGRGEEGGGLNSAASAGVAAAAAARGEAGTSPLGLIGAGAGAGAPPRV